ncbi:DUF5677 domain-containing protein [Daejeonella sp. H1SJ63]|uniref:DUF5677 domain-containing protein n=1 Tax=Daejeonella sp. H1SJ63 TaxID=3034145 RepID=UPI0023EB7096|nr:DUF5677 domain-containing protein [Daejeonella sp. H1SJ63]
MTNNEISKLQALLKITFDSESTTNIQYGEVVLQKVNVLLELIDSLATESVKIAGWKTWSEPIVFKFCYHTCSLIHLFNGTELPVKFEGAFLKVLDEPSIIIILRTILENYLTFHYLYIDNISDEEKVFRLLVYRYSGLKQRSEFDIINTSKAKEKQIKEGEQVQDLKDQITQSNLFKSYSSKQRTEILDGKKARLFNSWAALIKKSNLNTHFFKNLYGYKSNYSHSEFISIMQIKDGGYRHSDANTRSHHLLMIVQLLVCKTIIELKAFFPTMESKYSSFEQTMQTEIEYLHSLSINDGF